MSVLGTSQGRRATKNRTCTHKLLIAHSSRGCVTSCPFGPNAVGLQYGLHGLGWSQRLSVISRIKGAEWSAFQKFAVLPI